MADLRDAWRVAHRALSAWLRRRTSNRHRGALRTRAFRAARLIAWDCDLRTGLIVYEVPAEVFGLPSLPFPFTARQALRLVHPADRREVLRRARVALRHCEPFVHHLRIQPRPDSAPLWMEQHGQVICDRRGRPVRLAGALIDITAHRQALDALAVADRRKDDFLATLAHELRNPLSAIATASQLLRHAPLEPRQVAECVSMIRRQAAHLGRLVDDLLDISRVIRDRLELRREPTDLCGLVGLAIESTKELISGRRHQLHVALPAETLHVRADPVRLTQVVGNLLANAAKYTPEGGRIEVRVERGQRWAVLRVRDSGIGIAPEELPHVFEPFYQVDASLAHASGGLGIGLALVRRIVQLHEGTTEAISAGRGRGSEFVVKLPLLTSSPAPDVVRRAPAEIAMRSGPPLRVLIADDNADVAEAMALALRMCGHEVVVALDGEEALRLADVVRPHLALLDVGMPKREGHEVAREIRKREWAADSETLIVALTGWNPLDLQHRIDTSVFDSHLVKPTEMEVVNHLIQCAQQRTQHHAN